MQYCISDGILKHNRTKTFALAGKAVGTGIHDPCNRPIAGCHKGLYILVSFHKTMLTVANLVKNTIVKITNPFLQCA